MAETHADVRAVGGGSAESWSAAIVRAIAMLVIAFLTLGVVPNWLLDRLATRVTPTGRDLILVACWTLAFVVSAWAFVRLQRRIDRR
jgi:hypothetical protein